MNEGIAFAAHELALFAACGFILFGADDLLVDLIWIGRSLWRRAAIYSRYTRADAAESPAPYGETCWKGSTAVTDPSTRPA